MDDLLLDCLLLLLVFHYPRRHQLGHLNVHQYLHLLLIPMLLFPSSWHHHFEAYLDHRLPLLECRLLHLVHLYEHLRHLPHLTYPVSLSATVGTVFIFSVSLQSLIPVLANTGSVVMANVASSGNKNKYSIRIVIPVIIPKHINLHHFLVFLPFFINSERVLNKIILNWNLF